MADKICFLWPYLKIWDWELIFGRAVKAISSLFIRSPCIAVTAVYHRAGAPVQVRPARLWYYLHFSEQNAVTQPYLNQGAVYAYLITTCPPPRFLDLPPFLNIDMVKIKNNSKNLKKMLQKMPAKYRTFKPLQQVKFGLSNKGTFKIYKKDNEILFRISL